MVGSRPRYGPTIFKSGASTPTASERVSGFTNPVPYPGSRCKSFKSFRLLAGGLLSVGGRVTPFAMVLRETAVFDVTCKVDGFGFGFGFGVGWCCCVNVKNRSGPCSVVLQLLVTSVVSIGPTDGCGGLPWAKANNYPKRVHHVQKDQKTTEKTQENLHQTLCWHTTTAFGVLEETRMLPQKHRR